MHKLLKGFLLGLVMAFIVSGSAMALTITLDDMNDGIDVFAITDGSVLDENAIAGLVQYNGNIGNWLSNVTIGTSYPALGTDTNPNLDLFSLSLSTLGTGGTIAVSVSDTYAEYGELDEGINAFVASIGGTTQGSVDFIANINGIDFLIDWADMTHDGTSFSAAVGMSLADYTFDDNDKWDMTLTAVVTQVGVGITTLDAHLAAPVPEPATMLLFGMGLLGLAGVSRRKVNN